MANRNWIRILRTAAVGVFTGCILGVHPGLNAEQKPGARGISPEQNEFFEKHIRPVLVENCYSCHSHGAEKLKAGLHLDTREGLLRGGESGPAIVSGNPDASLLIRAVRYKESSIQMPPKNKPLPENQVKALEDWIRMGAPDPRAENATIKSRPNPAEAHWAFQPIRPPSPPKVKNERWVKDPLDAFVLAKLESSGMHPSPAADRRTLIRRATFDLTGLPPTEQEVQDFLKDAKSNAFEKVVDRLLSSPHYGERWARHWLDVARYADTKGYVFEEERRYPYSYTFRDYVVRSFNEDLPYDRFLIEQLAADQLELGQDKRALAGMGFLTLGRRFLNNPHDIIDDRIDVVMRGTQALTVGCARCHDHKSDPISMKDYYGLYGIFASSHEPQDKPLLGEASLPPEFPAYEKERDKRKEELEFFRVKKEDETLAEIRLRSGDYLLAAQETRHLADSSKADNLARERKLDSGVVRRWVRAMEDAEKAGQGVLQPWVLSTKAAGTNSSADIQAVLRPAIEQSTNSVLKSWFSTNRPVTLKDLAAEYGKLLAQVDARWEGFRRENSNARALPAAPDEELRLVLHGPDAPANVPRGELRRMFDVPSAQKLRRLQRQLEELDATHAGAPPRAMVMLDNATPVKPRVFVRGNPNNPGPETSRRFLEVLAGKNAPEFQKGSGRLEMARAIASTNNPLTARVFVNRVWMHHFGSPLAPTPSDFGLRADPPSHPELLDELSWKFMAENWSIKKLHRRILLSSTYQQSSADNPVFRHQDPSNRLLWRMNRRRLDLESMRDTFLAVSGSLDKKSGGHSVEILTQPFSGRRSVYGFIERQNLPGFFRTFDFASPDTSAGQRFTTTVPQQALFLLNSPFIAEQSRNLTKNASLENQKTDSERIRTLYLRIFQRPPDADELALGISYLTHARNEAPPAATMPAWKYGYGRVTGQEQPKVEFTELPYFGDKTWKGSKQMPDPKIGWVQINSRGGHPGKPDGYAAIRRWIAPADGIVRIEGKLKHPASEGDGVRGRILSDRQGTLGSWQVRQGESVTDVNRLAVVRGETVDFVVECQKDENSDSFEWSPQISSLAGSEGTAKLAGNWSAERDFSGPQKELPRPLGSWERYAQALLLSNELMFVD